MDNQQFDFDLMRQQMIAEVVAETVNAPGAVPKSTWEPAASLVVQVTTADVTDGVAATPETLGGVVSVP